MALKTQVWLVLLACRKEGLVCNHTIQSLQAKLITKLIISAQKLVLISTDASQLNCSDNSCERVAGLL